MFQQLMLTPFSPIGLMFGLVLRSEHICPALGGLINDYGRLAA